MIARIFVGLLVILHVCSCPDLMAQNVLQIESSPRYGIPFIDSMGIHTGMGYVTFTIKNDTTVPIHLQIALSDEFQRPAPFEKGKFKVFVLPPELMPDTATFGGSISTELRNFLDKDIDTPSIFNKTPCYYVVNVW